MRTTLAIDDDVLAAARHLAQRENRSVGEVLSMLARKALQAGAGAASPKVLHGIPLLPRTAGARAVTTELVSLLRDNVPWCPMRIGRYAENRPGHATRCRHLAHHYLG